MQFRKTAPVISFSCLRACVPLSGVHRLRLERAKIDGKTPLLQQSLARGDGFEHSKAKLYTPVCVRGPVFVHPCL